MDCGRLDHGSGSAGGRYCAGDARLYRHPASDRTGIMSDKAEVAPPRRAALFINRKSRKGRNAADQVIAALEAQGIKVEIPSCQGPDDINHSLLHLRDSIDCAVIGGGDGTLNAAAPALMETQLPLGIIPLGTANDLARTLNIPADPEQAARIIAQGKQHRIDLGEVNGVPFFNVASIGFGVALTRALTSDSKKRFGIFGYPIAALRVARRLRPFHAEIRHGGTTTVTKTLHLAIGNGRHYGGGMTVSEDASIDDGKLDVWSLEVDSAWRLIRLLPALWRGTQGRWREVITLSEEALEVHTRHPRSINTDGEITTRTPADFIVRRRAVRVFGP
ncbi:Diacylglycerol kinase family protein [Granulibacter bethesdensis]|uniref:Diacylglycerol kinase family protein n=2 Tax=Granulibacter bethesdensis TaxID=364410 RepID=Q0BTW0_GRABC|nr:Diacylglycerol kinase family protein [Granulibacter bethesdensis CGDNIH1]AHJ69437.1 Diacylglycerol kinase family protein [Granulibacter bethesdensis]APH51550.1 Diacylglycerol kinase family protein [Granulibacter bethesdensis]APH64243.1 Diacylglycerol kinase family protein [Granulibacter bethesdensis]